MSTQCGSEHIRYRLWHWTDTDIGNRNRQCVDTMWYWTDTDMRTHQIQTPAIEISNVLTLWFWTHQIQTSATEVSNVSTTATQCREGDGEGAEVSATHVGNISTLVIWTHQLHTSATFRHWGSEHISYTRRQHFDTGDLDSSATHVGNISTVGI